MQKLVLDGYNLIYADPELKQISKSSLESARRRLVNRLTGYLQTKNVQLTVVFDGHGGITDVAVEIPGRLQLLYSPAGQTADDVILEILESSTNPREFVVVTSDMADIGRAARAMGASVIPSPEFLSRLGRRLRDATSEPEEAGTDDVDYWLRRFDEDDRDGSDG
jgi:predicted RNA-binding protein with PIN domain